MTKIFLVRHGVTDWNEAKRALGQADIAMNEKGRAQAEESADRLARHEIDAVYSSDLQRAADTARAIAGRHNLEVHLDPAFREIDQGEWTGLTTDEIRRRWRERWWSARHQKTRPRGEAPHQLRARCLEGLKRVAMEHPDGTVVIVGHGGMIRCMRAEALGWKKGRWTGIKWIGNGGIVFLEAAIGDGNLILSHWEHLDRRTADLDDPDVYAADQTTA